MKIKKPAILRTVGDKTMLIPVGTSTKEYNGIFTLNETGVTAYKALESGADEPQIIQAILDEFDIDEATAANDVAIFIKKLYEFDFIE